MGKSLLFLLTLIHLVSNLSPAFGAPAEPGTQTEAQIANSVLGRACTIGRENAVGLTVNSAEYKATRVRMGDMVLYPNVGEKFLVVHFTYRNPLSREQKVNQTTLDWVLVDSKKTSHKPEEGLVARESNSELLDASLKQGEGVDGFIVFRMPGRGTASRITVKNRQDQNTQAVNFTGFPVKALDPLFQDKSDPKDKTGANALDEMPAEIGAVYPTGLFDARVEKVELVKSTLLGKAPENGMRYAVVTVWVKNNFTGNFSPQSAHGFTYDLTDARGSSAEMHGDAIGVGSEDKVELDLKPGAEGRFRIVFMVPDNVGLGHFSIVEAVGRAFKYDLRTGAD